MVSPGHGAPSASAPPSPSGSQSFLEQGPTGPLLIPHCAGGEGRKAGRGQSLTWPQVPPGSLSHLVSASARTRHRKVQRPESPQRNSRGWCVIGFSCRNSPRSPWGLHPPALPTLAPGPGPAGSTQAAALHGAVWAQSPPGQAG